ncbi:hypothetical protein GIB67_005702 [Kingdonia uniflora]|uniref:RING-type E3 ubiquitin transferase n=1 Tax=Kingdonia uniflora TaxID=39325 RepID=A0A7J7NI24_9MAGN|nr:hypothetical protein GIB67_005702 [Kingdonia uniflora]
MVSPGPPGAVYCLPGCNDCIPGCKPFYLAPSPLLPPIHDYQYPPPPPPAPIPFLVSMTLATFGGSFLVIGTCYMIFSKFRSSFNNSYNQHPHPSAVMYILEGNIHTNSIASIRPIKADSKGLELSFINSIPVCKYKKGDGLVEATECLVCLYEFQENENLRILPNCMHAFHLTCIDTWLKLHIDCPLCRDRVDSYNPFVASRLIEPISSLDNGIPGEETRLSIVIEGGRGSADQRVNMPNSSHPDV